MATLPGELPNPAPDVPTQDLPGQGEPETPAVPVHAPPATASLP